MRSKTSIIQTISVIFLFIVLLFASVACDRNNDDDYVAPGDFGPGTGAGSNNSDDDDDTTSDDDDDDNDDDDDEIPQVAVVYRSEYYVDAMDALLKSRGINPTFVYEENTPAFDFRSYNAIIIMESCQFYSPSQWQAIRDVNKHILGMGMGGGIFFGKMGLFADLASATSYTTTRIIAKNQLDEIWNTPYQISMTTAGVVTLSSSLMNINGHNGLNPPADLFDLADLWGEVDRTVLNLQAGQYMHWGLEFLPTYYSTATINLLANCVHFLSTH